MEGGEENISLGGIEVAAIEICACTSSSSPPCLDSTQEPLEDVPGLIDYPEDAIGDFPVL